MKSFLIIAFSILAFNLQAQQFIFSDGNANSYLIFADKIKFDPVTSGNSSSGVYTGGEPKTKNISKEDFQKIKDLFEKAFNAKTDHTKARVMQSAVLIEKKGKKTQRQIILQPNSDHIDKIEEFLKTLL
jgi:hypothetical protein